MLAREFIVVFHETASGYTDRTQAMNEELRKQGVPVPTHPIVRLAYPTWDALAAVPDAEFRLPAHLALSFGSVNGVISAPEFAGSWRHAVQSRKDQLGEIKLLSRVREAMAYLEIALLGVSSRGLRASDGLFARQCAVGISEAHIDSVVARRGGDIARRAARFGVRKRR
jgi:hypothetical protein